jgi:saccharopine dehydrogenase-like NADP-dependent oxidoreductase
LQVFKNHVGFVSGNDKKSVHLHQNKIMPKRILLIGAGRSATVLISYLIQEAEKFDWFVTIGDLNPELAASKIPSMRRAKAVFFDVDNHELRKSLIADHDIVISMLPAHMHVNVAKDCVELKKDMATASYISEEMKQLHEAAVNKGITIINELGLDPGIDHLSAMEILDKLRAEGADIEEFESYCGGLIAPESDNNPWGYKFSWAPRNVVLAGQGSAAKYLEKGNFKYLPYQRLFKNSKRIEITNMGTFDGYANRDSLKYQRAYGLDNAQTIFRGTLRKSGFCEAWHAFVMLGMTDDSYKIEVNPNTSLRAFTNSFLPYDPQLSLEEKICRELQIKIDSEVFKKLEWLELFSERTLIPINSGSPAEILQAILEKKWLLLPDDKDMIVMWHRFVYELNGRKWEKHSWLRVIGKNAVETAMAQTVGLPLGIGVKLLAQGKIAQKGVLMPLTPEFYTPILKELKNYGIQMHEKTIELP